MKFTNNMSNLIDKVSNRLGIDIMMDKLPKCINKSSWVDLIQNEVLNLYSRYYPHCIQYKCKPERDYNHNTGLYIINTDYINSSNIKILGIKSISRNEKKKCIMPEGYVYTNNIYYGNNIVSDPINSTLDIMQGLTTHSYFPDQLFIEFYPPNGFKITNISYTDIISNRISIEIDLLVNHPKSLITISQTSMSLFEDLCTSKIAEFIYGTLKYFDGIETGYQTIDLKLDTVQEWINRKDEILNIINDSYVSLSNRNQPSFYII